MAEEETYTAPEAAKILRLSERRVQQMLQQGELPGTKLDNGQWAIPKHAVHSRKDETRSKRRKRPPAAWKDGRIPADLINELRGLERTVGALQARLELTEVAESTLREQLARERERADRLEAQLEAERSKGFWSRLFGRQSHRPYAATSEQ